jgi:Holliday junction resolvase RusA-like endonuclease
MQGKPIAESCGVCAVIHVAHNRHADIDNYLKTIFDALQAAGIIKNDHLIDSVKAKVIRGAKKGVVFIEVRSVTDAEKAVGEIIT